MFKMLLVLFIGSVLGFLLRDREKIVKISSKLLMFSLYILLLFLGISIGKDEKIMENLPILGVNSMLISIFGILGSSFFAYLFYTFFMKKDER